MSKAKTTLLAQSPAAIMAPIPEPPPVTTHTWPKQKASRKIGNVQIDKTEFVSKLEFSRSDLVGDRKQIIRCQSARLRHWVLCQYGWSVMDATGETSTNNWIYLDIFFITYFANISCG